MWANITEEAGEEGWGNASMTDGGQWHGIGNGTGTGIILNVTAVAEVAKNATLVAICEAWVIGMAKGNLSEIDAGKWSG
jgi:hypothetical protein